MKKHGKTILIALVVSGIVVGGFLWLLHRYQQEHAQMDAIIKPMILDMARSQWSRDAFDRHASQGLREWFIKGKHEKGMPGLNFLGALKSYDGIEQITEKEAYTIVITKVTFEKDPDTYITLQLSEQEEGWKLDAFNINSSVLKKHMRGE